MTGQIVPHWSARRLPTHGPMSGRFIRLEPLAANHGDSLFAAVRGHDDLWRYLPYGPFDRSGLTAWINDTLVQTHTLFFALCDPTTGAALGVASYLRIAPDHGCAEVGHLNFSPALQGSRAASEAMALLMGHIFDLGYRRYEWKCDACNLASRRAAQRLGFSFEGVFRQHRISKGRNRDTAWFSILDTEAPALRNAYAQWLHDDNFNDAGEQRTSLSHRTRPILTQVDPALG